MSEKYLIFGATGSIGSSLAEQLVNSGNSVHIVGRNENETKNISEKLGGLFWSDPSILMEIIDCPV